MLRIGNLSKKNKKNWDSQYTRLPRQFKVFRYKKKNKTDKGIQENWLEKTQK